METEGKVNVQEGGQEASQETSTFDVSAFVTQPTRQEINKNESSQESTEQNEVQQELSNESEESDFVWGTDISVDDESNQNENEGNTNENGQEQEESSEGSADSSNSNTGDQSSSSDTLTISDEQFSVFSEELGLTAKTKDEFTESIKKIVEENEKLKKNYPKSNEKIDTFEKLINLDDKELVKQNLIADGFEGEDLENAIERYLDNGLIDIEAKKIRNTINKAIDNERKLLIDSEVQSEAMQSQEREEGIKELNKYLNSTDEMFGFKMATPDKLDNVRKSHQEYITSGKFLTDITKDEKSLAESAWLWKNKDTILKAMRNQGFNKGRADVIKHIGNPDPEAGTRTYVDPKAGGEFDPNKFIAR